MSLAGCGPFVSIRFMAEPSDQSGFWKGVAVLGLLTIGAAMLNSGSDAESEDEDDLYEEDLDTPLRPGRDFELALVGALEVRHGNRVLDNPWVTARDGQRMKPDVVVLERSGREIREVREAKDVGILQEAHVWQALRYDDELVPSRGTTIDVPERTFVPPEVARLAKILDIDISRWRRRG